MKFVSLLICLLLFVIEVHSNVLRTKVKSKYEIISKPTTTSSSSSGDNMGNYMKIK